MVAASAFVKMDVKNAAKIYRRDRRNHASPNSAQTEAAMAGALEVQLAGNAYYFGKLYEKPTSEMESALWRWRISDDPTVCFMQQQSWGCDLPSDRKRSAHLFLFIIPVTVC